jgi:hypothetical protein
MGAFGRAQRIWSERARSRKDRAGHGRGAGNRAGRGCRAGALAREGARVLLTDLNGEGAFVAARAIDAEIGKGTAFATRHEVTSEVDWKAAIAYAGPLGARQ